MKNPPEVKDGDRVRVVLEGEVKGIAPSGAFGIGEVAAVSGNWITTTADHVIRVEVLPKSYKVGDKVTSQDPEPPVCSCVITTIGLPYYRGPVGWQAISTSGLYSWSDFSKNVPYTIVYLPDQ